MRFPKAKDACGRCLDVALGNLFARDSCVGFLNVPDSIRSGAEHGRLSSWTAASLGSPCDDFIEGTTTRQHGEARLAICESMAYTALEGRCGSITGAIFSEKTADLFL